MSKFRVIYDEYGQTCNRFFSYIDSIAWAIMNNKKVIILFPEEILYYYNNLRNSKYIYFPLYEKQKCIWRFFRKIFYYNNLIQYFYKTRLSKQIGFYAGWDLHADTKFYPNVFNEIVELFKPNGDISEPIDNIFDTYKNTGKIIVGIHIRKGDYKEYRGGEFYYDDTVYITYMHKIKQLFPNCLFFISSNEKVSNDYDKFERVIIPISKAPHDLYALSKCDFILGPPSSFSSWASLMGRVPLYHLRNTTIELSKDMFVPFMNNLLDKN